jgi:hypothetical protein
MNPFPLVAQKILPVKPELVATLSVVIDLGDALCQAGLDGVQRVVRFDDAVLEARYRSV